MTKQEYDDRVRQLKNAAGTLLGSIESQLEHDSPDDFSGGNPFDNERLRRVAAQIDNVLGSYDALQKGLDPKIEPRHQRFLHGRCNE
jgi:hypothetical protein